MIHISRGRHRPGALAAVIGAAALLVAACTGTPAHPATGNPQAGPVPAQVAPSDSGQPSPVSQPAQPARSASQPTRHSATPSPRPTPPAPAPTSPPAVPPVTSCATADLSGSFGPAAGAAGTFYYPVQLTNTSRSVCTLFGYPGVSVVTTPSGSQVGDQAVRIPTFSPRLVTIVPGDTVHALLQMPNPGVLSPSVCVPDTVRWLRVYPPGEFTPLLISVPVTANPVQICTGHHLGNIIPLGIFVVMPGSTGS